MTDKTQMPKEVYLNEYDYEWFPKQDTENKHRFARLDPDDIVISRKALEGAKEYTDQYDSLQLRMVINTKNQTIDKILNGEIG